MADLRAEFFKRDLGPDEDATLAAQLDGASDEEAAGFARLAEQDYQAMGLPRPVWPEPKRRRWPLLAFALLGAGAAAWLWVSVNADSARTVALPAGTAPDLDLAPPAPERPQAAPAPEAPAPAPRVAPKLQVRAGAGGFAARLQPSVDGASTLQVLDRQGRVLRRLAADAQGQWLWDGQDGAHMTVAPGAYQFRVDAGGRALTQWVQVRRVYAP
jgi:hypothetical protein